VNPSPIMKEFFSPRTIAVIGASREKGKVGYEVFKNVTGGGFNGRVFPVNPKTDHIDGHRCYPSISAVPGRIDLAVVVVPSRSVPRVIQECGEKGIKACVIISAGFKETGGEGARLEKNVVEIADKYNMRLIGPNCLGIIDTHSGLNASFATHMPRKGEIAFISQSGALCTAILDWSKAEGLGFSKFISMGNEADLCETDFLEALADDPHTKVIIGYLESIRDGQRFMRVASRISRNKPIVLIKSGGTDAGARAASSHTGSLAGSDQAYEAAFRQCGVLRARSVEELFDLGTALAFQPLPEGRRVAILTNAGGPGIMATDACEHAGLTLASLNRPTVDFLRANLPEASNFYNPVDVLGDAKADRYQLALDAVCKDTNVEAVIVLLTPQAMTEVEKTAESIGGIASDQKKTVLTCFMGEAVVRPGIEILKRHRIPNYPFPERASSALAAMARYHEWLGLPDRKIKSFHVDRVAVRRILKEASSKGQINLAEFEARKVISAYGIPIPKSRLASSAQEAVEAASEIGWPVAMKVASPDILHKSDIGAVKLGIITAEEVRDAFDLITMRTKRYMPEAKVLGVSVQQMVTEGKEVILGMTRDPQFGPLILFGLGGIYVEVLKDISFRVAPLSEYDAKEMIQEIRSYHLLSGIRGERPAEIDSIVEALLRVSQLAMDFPQIVELDINPLKVREPGQGAIAIDVRLTIGG